LEYNCNALDEKVSALAGDWWGVGLVFFFKLDIGILLCKVAFELFF
jgi:hypothetical protein